MYSLISLSFLILLILSQISAYWGPKRLLIVSAISSFLGGLCIGLIQGINLPNVILGSIIGIFFSVFNVLSGLYNRYWAKRGRKKVDHYLKEHPNFLKDSRKGPK
jgi:MFS family permease